MSVEHKSYLSKYGLTRIWSGRMGYLAFLLLMSGLPVAFIEDGSNLGVGLLAGFVGSFLIAYWLLKKSDQLYNAIKYMFYDYTHEERVYYAMVFGVLKHLPELQIEMRKRAGESRKALAIQLP